MAKYNTSDFILKDNVYYPNYDILLNLSVDEQKEYLNAFSDLTHKDIKPTEYIPKEWSCRLSDWSMGKKFGQIYRYETFIQHIDDKMKAGVIFCEKTMKDYEYVKNSLKNQFGDK